MHPRSPREASAEASRPRPPCPEWTPTTAPNEITVPQLARLVGLPDAPAVVDVRLPEDVARDPRTLPGSVARDNRAAPAWAREFAGRGGPVVVLCQRGLKLSQGTVAWLRHEGVLAEALEGGFEAWRAAGPRHWSGRTTSRPATRAAARSG